MDVININIHECTAGTIGIKGWQNTALFKAVISSGVLRIVTLHNFYISQGRQKFFNSFIIRQMQGCNRFKQKQLLLSGQSA